MRQMRPTELGLRMALGCIRARRLLCMGRRHLSALGYRKVGTAPRCRTPLNIWPMHPAHRALSFCGSSLAPHTSWSGRSSSSTPAFWPALQCVCKCQRPCTTAERAADSVVPPLGPHLCPPHPVPPPARLHSYSKRPPCYLRIAAVGAQAGSDEWMFACAAVQCASDVSEASLTFCAQRGGSNYTVGSHCPMHSSGNKPALPLGVLPCHTLEIEHTTCHALCGTMRVS